MNITLTGSLGNISQGLTEQLTARGHRVTVVSHNPSRAGAIERLGARPAIGSVEDRVFLRSAFGSADAVYTMIPPNFGATDIRAYMRTVGDAYADALAQTGVRYVVNLSSVGAHIPDGPGPTGTNHAIEQQLNALEATHVLHLRPGMFYTNFFGNIPMIRDQHIIGNNFDASVPMALTDPRDIAGAAADALDKRSFTGKGARYVVSDELNGAQVAAILGQAIGHPDLPWVCFPDEALLEGMIQSGLSRDPALVYVVEIGIGLRNGKLLEDYHRHRDTALGKTRFSDFAADFAGAYKNSAR